MTRPTVGVGSPDPRGDEAWDAYVAGAEPGSYLQLSGWKRLIARPFMSAFRKIANKALEEDRIDLESCGYPVAA